MLTVKLITVGTLKEAYWRDAAAEYEKRLGGLCRLESINLKEAKLPNNPSPKEIAKALEEEAQQILAAMPPRSYKIALCVEGKQLSSEAFADKLEQISAQSGTVCLVVGSSFGLSDTVKRACDHRLSISEMTFPHQLLRVMLLEILYRSFQIQKGTQYHK